ncbi:zinc finger CCCH domain-containing protein 37 isoform X2 [Tanacetum coccineum]|uniref:Zinc finger CCCH domain-containing protein 37 isoform X2 n=1 Tax=Tanacetum coccineum TaxID=301880 RepID=A0ABQ5CPU2_9ASTR
MANHLYDGYGTSSDQSTKSLVDQYAPSDPSYYRNLAASDPLISSFKYSSMYADKDSLVGRSTLVGSLDLNSSVDSLLAGFKRPASEVKRLVSLESKRFRALRFASSLKRSLFSLLTTLLCGEAWYSANPLVKRPKFQSSLSVFPQRPGEKDCAHYMLTRTCKFGDSCIFDHPLWVPEGGITDWKEVPTVNDTSEPLPERQGVQDCPFFLKTQKCKFGPSCKFNHPKDKAATSSALGNNEGSELPERPSEPPCSFYMKNGVCKYGSACKFHHPKDISVATGGAGNANGGQIEGITGGTAGSLAPSTPPFTPALLHNSKGLPIRPGEADCPFYLKTGSCKYSATCRYNHPERYVMVPPALRMNIGLVSPTPFLQTLDSRVGQTTLGLGISIYPQRPGQLECDYYMKTGACMFGERCKYHHPLDRTSHALSAKEGQQNIVKFTLAGLPRREGAVNCPYYMKTGACKYGVTCKFDHPPPGEVMAAVTSQGASTTTGEEVKEDHP